MEQSMQDKSQGYGELIAMMEESGFENLTEGNGGQMTKLSLDSIHVKEQVRREFEDDENSLRELADDIIQQGVIQPIVVRPDPDGEGYELVAGERRLRASRMADLDRIPAVIRHLSDDEASRVQMAENIHRKNLTQIEEARRLKSDLDRLGGDTDALLRRYNKRHSWLSKWLALLDLGPHAERLVNEDLTSDIEIIYGAKGLEKLSPERAEEFVEELASESEGDGSRNLRKRLLEYRDKARKENQQEGAKKKKKAFKPKPATMPNPNRRTQPLHTFYQMVVRKKMSGREAIDRMDLDDRRALLEMIDHAFNLGNASDDLVADLVNNLRKGDMAGGAAFLFVPFLMGGLHGEDDTPMELVDRIKGVSDPSKSESEQPDASDEGTSEVDVENPEEDGSEDGIETHEAEDAEADRENRSWFGG